MNGTDNLPDMTVRELLSDLRAWRANLNRSVTGNELVVIAIHKARSEMIDAIELELARRGVPVPAMRKKARR